MNAIRHPKPLNRICGRYCEMITRHVEKQKTLLQRQGTFYEDKLWHCILSWHQLYRPPGGSRITALSMNQTVYRLKWRNGAAQTKQNWDKYSFWNQTKSRTVNSVTQVFLPYMNISQWGKNPPLPQRFWHTSNNSSRLNKGKCVAVYCGSPRLLVGYRNKCVK